MTTIDVVWRDYGIAHHEQFDPSEGTTITVDGPSVIHIGPNLELLDDISAPDERLEPCPVDRDENNRIPEESLLQDVRRLWGELGRWPEPEDVDEHGRYSRSTYYNRFGLPWEEIVDLALDDSRSGAKEERHD